MSGQTCFVTMFKWISLYILIVYGLAVGAAQNGPSGCVLPPYPPHGTYTVYDKPEAVPGQTYDFASLTVSCDSEHGVVGSNTTYCFGRNIWLQPLPQCTRFCRLTPEPSVNYSCKVTGDDIILSGTRRCRELEPDGTVVEPECNRPVYYSSVVLPNMRCEGGTWDYIAVCQPDCGTFTPVGEGLIINGTRVKRGELPWHAAIYDKTYTPFMQVCGGSLISTKVVISAAHCFWDDATGRQQASRYAVALGKIYRPWNNDMDPGVHRSHVSKIEIPVRFLGAAGNNQEDIALVVMATPVVYVTYIRPVCIDFDAEFDRSQLQNSNLGRVSGWGLTSADGDASQVLLTTELSYVDVEKCITSLPDEFRPLITSDKICAGGNGATVCRGDSGGGLAFPIVDRGNRRRYFLCGVVSTAPTNGHQCNTNSYTTFTHILPHATFIKDRGLGVVSERDGSSTTEYTPPVNAISEPNLPIIKDCREPLPGFTAAKTGRKAWDKCIEYKEDLIYPCRQSEALSGGIARSNNCKHDAKNLIVDGGNAGQDEFPHMVSLGYGQTSETAFFFWCGGTLLSEKFILTAAHCTEKNNYGPVTYAIVGYLKRSDNVASSQVYRIQKIIKHPQYQVPSYYHDIALLETLNPITLGASAVPACLDIFGGNTTMAVATGWSGTGADILKKVFLKKLKEKECKQYFPLERILAQGFDPDTQICYGPYTEGSDTCQGDSGGPLTITNPQATCTYIIVGVTTLGMACGYTKTPGLYTKVSYYVPWIESIVWP